MKAPFLSTKFSESGKKAKHRFDNILSPQTKHTGALVLMLVIILAGVINAAVNLRGTAENGSFAIAVEETNLFLDPELSVHSEHLAANDLVGVLYKHSDDVYYVRRAVTEAPSIEGYISKDKLSFEFDEANQGVIAIEHVYDAPDLTTARSDIDALGKVCSINERLGDWLNISLPGGIDDMWIKSEDISYSLSFDSAENEAGGYYRQIKDYLQRKYTEAYKPYYDSTVVEYLANYRESVDDKAKTLEAEFTMNASYRNYYKDPDTVEYIKNAKINAENSDDEYYRMLYKTYYEEYNQLKNGNYIIKLTAALSRGKIDESSVKLYTNDGQNGEWYELKKGFKDFIID